MWMVENVWETLCFVNEAATKKRQPKAAENQKSMLTSAQKNIKSKPAAATTEENKEQTNSNNEEIGRRSHERYGSAKDAKREDEAVERQATPKQKGQDTSVQAVGCIVANPTSRQKGRCTLGDSQDDWHEQDEFDRMVEEYEE